MGSCPDAVRLNPRFSGDGAARFRTGTPTDPGVWSELLHLRERAGHSQGPGAEVHGHPVCVSRNDRPQAVGVVGDAVAAVVSLDDHLRLRFEGAVGEVASLGP